MTDKRTDTAENLSLLRRLIDWSVSEYSAAIFLRESLAWVLTIATIMHVLFELHALQGDLLGLLRLHTIIDLAMVAIALWCSYQMTIVSGLTSITAILVYQSIKTVQGAVIFGTIIIAIAVIVATLWKGEHERK